MIIEPMDLSIHRLTHRFNNRHLGNWQWHSYYGANGAVAPPPRTLKATYVIRADPRRLLGGRE